MAVLMTRMPTNYRNAQYRRYSESGTADTLLASSIAPGVPCRLCYVHVTYSAAPTQAGATVDLDSVVGAAHDANLHTGSANTRYTRYEPAHEMILGKDDALTVTAPAGGSGITAHVLAVFELV